MPLDVSPMSVSQLFLTFPKGEEDSRSDLLPKGFSRLQFGTLHLSDESFEVAV